jgi:putrescine transport system permease protein
MKRSGFLISALAFGYAFLYVPIIILIVYSFNAGRNVAIWAGWSTQWYSSMLDNKQLVDAAVRSLTIAAIASTVACVLGTLAGYIMARFGRFRGRTLFSGMITAPLVMPEVITGLSMLLMFVAMENLLGFPRGRGMLTITIAHITFCMSYVTVVVQSRLVSMDASVEEAAMDLGARPVGVFFKITLPIIAPAIIAGWLLSFTLSLDTLVISSFVSGPGSTTFPMYIFSKVRLGVTPEINALATVIVVLVTVGVVVAGIFMMRQERMRLRDERMAAAAAAAA